MSNKDGIIKCEWFHIFNPTLFLRQGNKGEVQWSRRYSVMEF